MELEAPPEVEYLATSPVTPFVIQPDTPSQTELEIAIPRELKKAPLPEGKTLRLLAEDIFGDREFWVYIYLENRDRISNPNRVPSGIELVLPDKSAYSINAADPYSVAKAKSLGDEVLKEF
ncbi:MAG: hypothetical protein GXZ19_02460 [Bacteroidales bacterium]|nr:hypothetical protein [Bacteroidales bacterium]